jgi:hypothetical protein
MKAHPTTWFIMAAILWLWGALAAALHFTEMPALFHLPATAPESAASSWGGYELYVFTVLVLFIFYSRPGLKIWTAAIGIGFLVLAKIIWLEPLLYFRAHTIWHGDRPFDFLPPVYIGFEITKTGLLLLTSYWIYRAWAGPAKMETKAKRFLSIRDLARKQVPHPN